MSEIEVDTSALMDEFMSGPRMGIGVASNDLASQLVASIAEEFESTVLSELIASMNALTARVQADEERQREFTVILERLAENAERDHGALVAALHQMSETLSAQPEPVVNVTVEPPEIVFPDIPAPRVTVKPPEVNVTVEAQPSKRSVTVKRDPLTGLISSAEVSDGG